MTELFHFECFDQDIIILVKGSSGLINQSSSKPLAGFVFGG
jgi:hypothetical protein